MAAADDQQLKRQNDTTSLQPTVVDADVDQGTRTPAGEIESEMPDVPQSPPHKKTKFLALNSDAPTTDRESTPTPLINSNLHLPIPTHPPVLSTAHPSHKHCQMSALEVRLIEGEGGKAPTQGSALAVGYDLYSSEKTTVPARGRAIVKTGIQIALPVGTYGRVAPRSGLAAKHGIDTGAGVIDPDYRGEVKVILFNFSDDDFQIEKHDRIAQLILERVVTPEVKVVTELSETVRGETGFGSTGGFGKPAEAAAP